MKKITGTLEAFLRHNVKPECYDEVCKIGIAEWLDDTSRSYAEVDVERRQSVCNEPFVFRINHNDIEEDVDFHEWFDFRSYGGRIPEGVYLVRGEGGELAVCERKNNVWIGEAKRQFIFTNIKLLTRDDFEKLV